MKHEAGYDGELVQEFLREHGTLREDGRLFSLNGITLTYSQREKTTRWEGRERISIDQFDRFLMAHGLMLFEFEDWARATHGRDGYLDPYAEPAGLVG